MIEKNDRKKEFKEFNQYIDLQETTSENMFQNWPNFPKNTFMSHGKHPCLFKKGAAASLDKTTQNPSSTMILFTKRTWEK